jgi:hypothetical protein
MGINQSNRGGHGYLRRLQTCDCPSQAHSVWFLPSDGERRAAAIAIPELAPGKIHQFVLSPPPPIFVQ